MEKERIKKAIDRIEHMLNKSYQKAPKEFMEDMLIMVNIAKEFYQRMGAAQDKEKRQIKRYSLINMANEFEPSLEMVETESGEWVKFEDIRRIK